MKIDREFEALIPPLSDEEFRQLEENILAEGCRESILVWMDEGEFVIVDGHNRFKICQKHNLPYNHRQMYFKDRNEVIQWMILNQFGRRNLSAYDRSVLALKLKPVIQEQAKKNQKAAGGAVPQKSAKAVDTREELSKIAGVSHDTIHKVDVIQQKAPERVKELVKSGEISINQGYHETMNIIKPNPKPIQKQAKERHEEIKNSDVISITDIKADVHDQVIIALGICKDLIRLENELTSISTDEDIKCIEKLEKEDVRDAIRTCNKILHQAENIRKEFTRIYGN